MVYLLVGWLVYSCCSHLEHRTYVKRFVSLQFLNLRHSVGLHERVISPSQGRYLTNTQNKHKQTSMPRVVFEHTFQALERAKTVHGLDRATNVIGNGLFVWKNFPWIEHLHSMHKGDRPHCPLLDFSKCDPERQKHSRVFLIYWRIAMLVASK
jgi:hypothetical protein